MPSAVPLNLAEVQTVIELCRQAGAAILEFYRPEGQVDVQTKADDSPITKADLAAHNILVAGLEAMSPWPVLSEESIQPKADVRQGWQRHWLVDPLDGTKEFITGSGEFTVNVALIAAGKPVFGVVYVPCQDLSYFGGPGWGAFKRSKGQEHALQTRPMTGRGSAAAPVVVVASRRHGLDAVEGLMTRLRERAGEVQSDNVGSSLKFCLIAEGKADLYPRLGPTSEWDTAAAQAVVEGAGGAVVDQDFSPLGYNHKDSILNPDFYVLGDPTYPWAACLG